MNYLPIVNPEVGFSIAHEVDGQDDDVYMENQLKLLEEENPAISKWIETFSERTDDPQGASYCALLVYKMLRSQAEADYLNEQFNLET